MKSDRLDLRPEHHALVRSILRKHAPAYRAWVFGSRVRGTAKPMSDLDLAIEGPEPLGEAVLGAMQEAFSQSRLPMKVDIVDLAAISPSFRCIIDAQKIPLTKDEVLFDADRDNDGEGVSPEEIIRILKKIRHR